MRLLLQALLLRAIADTSLSDGQCKIGEDIHLSDWLSIKSTIYTLLFRGAVAEHQTNHLRHLPVE